MGGIFSSDANFKESFRKNQEYISEMNRIKVFTNTSYFYYKIYRLK